jgi:hypothetical protein
MWTAMPRYHFHARGPTDFVPDLKGEELRDLEAAFEHAAQFAREIKIGSVIPEHWDGWSVEIADASGNAIATVTLTDR